MRIAAAFLTSPRRWLVVSAIVALTGVSLPGATNDRRPGLSADLLEVIERASTTRERVIVRGTREQVDAMIARHGVALVRRLANGAVVSADSRAVAALAADETVEHLSGDALVVPAMAVSNRAVGADQTWAGSPGVVLGLGAIPGVTGQGVGVAVIDSGISPHSALANRVVANVSFVTGDPQVADAYGHGTHVAGIIAGSAAPAGPVTAAYAGGVAPGVHLVNVRVIGAAGLGYTSDVIAGIDWVIANRARYNIRVINLSLGHPVMEPAATDPLCQAVARAAAAGIVVVASAGNDGRSADGRKVLGGISSPGNSPFAITVGALNTWGTAGRSDDTVAEYSSRGPARFDMTVKPDIAAPGTRIVSLEASGSYLPSAHPSVHSAGFGSNAYMRLNGTSMSAPIVTGAAALLLQGAPAIGPAQVKLALQSGATYVPDGGLMGAGAGSLNIWASRRIAADGLSALTGSLLGGLVTTPSGASFWDAGTLSARLYSGVGLRLLSGLDLRQVWNNPAYLRVGDLNLVGLANPLRLVAPKRLMWGQVAAWSSDDQIIWGTSMSDDNGDQIIWGTSGDDQIIWGTTTMTDPDAR
jgi:serine protease AprX